MHETASRKKRRLGIRGPAAAAPSWTLANGLAFLADGAHDIFVRNLRFWLLKRGVKAAELARQIGKGQSTISQWFRGESSPHLQTMEAAANVLDVPLWYLVFDGEPSALDPTAKPTTVISNARLVELLADRLKVKARIER